MKYTNIILFALFMSAVTATAEGEITTVRITDRVKRQDAMRLGWHLGSDTPYDSPILKKRVAENFEGVLYRQIFNVEPVDESSAIGLHGMSDEWMAVYREGPVRYWVVSGPDRWTTGEAVVSGGRKKGKFTEPRFDLDKAIAWHSEKNGLLIEVDHTQKGAFGKGPRSSEELLDFSTYSGVSDQNVFEHERLPPGTTGKTALRLNGAKEPAFYMEQVLYESADRTIGDYRVRLWARSVAGEPELYISIGGPPAEKVFTPKDRWQIIETELTVTEPQGVASLKCEAQGGDVLIDDVEVWKLDAEDWEDSFFRHNYHDILTRWNPGVTRLLRNSGNSMYNAIVPAIRAVARRSVPYGSYRRESLSMHEYYALCAEIGCAAWANLPGTHHPEEMERYMEYLGAPPDRGWGKLRAELGQEKPWTEVLDTIYVQFGNELVTFPLTGYFGPDYWQDLIARAKASPYYSKNVKFVIDHQPNAWESTKYVDNADMLCSGNYILNGFWKEEVKKYLNTDDKLFRYALAYPYWRWDTYMSGNKYRDIPIAESKNLEIAIYEGGNYHLTFGDAASDIRNRLCVSLGGQLSMVNNMLYIQKEYGVRAQNKFNFAQFNFSGHGSFGHGISVRLWGHVMGFPPEKRRYRPGYVLAEAANRVVFGDIMETVHEGAVPTFSAEGVLKPSRTGLEDCTTGVITNVPVINSYAFKDGLKRGLVLTNLDIEDPREVKLVFDGVVRGDIATAYTVTADKITANNEPDWVEKPEVVLKEETIRNFSTGYTMKIPPFTLIALKWSE